jgi:hypothetical protein
LVLGPLAPFVLLACSGTGAAPAAGVDAGADAGGVIVDLSPPGVPIGTAAGIQGVGLQVTFGGDTSIVAIEINSQMLLGSMTGTVWDATTGAVLATGSVVPPGAGGDEWHHSTIAFHATAGRSYIIGGAFSSGWSGLSWDSAKYPYSVDGVTVVADCMSGEQWDGGLSVSSCGVAPSGDTTIALRLVEAYL